MDEVDAVALDKDDLALVMMAAWCNVRVEQLPEEARHHPNDYTRLAWKRVADAVIAALDAARGDPVAQVVEWLRKREGVFKRRDNALADAIERGEPFNG